MALVDVIIGYAKGAQGDVGPQGPEGPQGPQGPQGPLPTLVNNALSTTPGVAALDAAMGKTLQDHIDTTNSNLTNKIKRGDATVSFTNSVGTLIHNCGFPDTDYTLIFMPTATSRFPMMATPIDGNSCQLAVRDWTNASGNITVTNFNGTATIKWIAIK